METPVLYGQPSWPLVSDRVGAFVTVLGGHLGPVTFRLEGREVSPLHVAPWAEEAVGEEVPAMLRVLRGDFFCMPFGGSETPFDGEQHPPHGETANAPWTLVGTERDGDRTTLRLRLGTTVRAGHVEKHVTLRDGHAAVYQRHVVSGMSGPMSFGHHAMLRFPDREGSGLVATSPFLEGHVAPEPIETERTGGASALLPGSRFSTLDAVPLGAEGTTDLSRYPARRGFEDLVLMMSDPSRPFAWTAVTFPEEGYVWFALKNPRVLRHTIFWCSNGGRRYAPWNGRHVNVLGLEEVTSYFHLGLPASAHANPFSVRGIPTSADLDPDRPLDVRYVMAAAAVPEGFDHVADITPDERAPAVILTARSGARVTVPLDYGFVAT